MSDRYVPRLTEEQREALRQDSLDRINRSLYDYYLEREEALLLGEKPPEAPAGSAGPAPPPRREQEPARAFPRGTLDERAVIELKRNPAATPQQLAAALGCRPGTLRDKRKCPMLARARAMLKAQRQAFREGSTWRDRRPDDDEA